jgi:hypothetical protein
MSSQLRATFLYHCAFAHSDKQPHVDVLLAPSTMEMEHIASLRVPEACVVDDAEHPGEEQETEDADRRVTTDVIWRLEGYDLWIDPPEAPAPDRVRVDLSFRENQNEWVVADFKRLSHVGIDATFLDEDVPNSLKPGARVRIWGGYLQAAKPEKGLVNRLWRLDNGTAPVGLSDRVEFTKDLENRSTMKLRFRKFGEVRFKTVTLRATAGIVRLHVMNDPTVEEMHDPALATCDALPHFQSYSLLVRASADGRQVLQNPRIVEQAGIVPATIAEGADLCCPCGGGPPEP